MNPRQGTQRSADKSKLEIVALFKENEYPTTDVVPLDQIVLPSTQPRCYFDPKSMQSLMESVKRDGIFHPLLVRPLSGKYELVAGERRYKAAQSAGLTKVPVTIREMSNQQAIQYAITVDLQREDLNPIEETQGILQLLTLRLGCEIVDVTSLLYRMENEAKNKVKRNVSGNDGAETVEKVFDELGRMNWRSFVRTRLTLLKLPNDILEALQFGQIEYTKALEIAKLEFIEDRTELLEATIELSLSLSEIKEQVKRKQPATKLVTLQSRLETAYKKVKKSKVWDNPQKQRKLESLLAELEALVTESE